MKKARKQRTTGHDICSGCGCINCDPAHSIGNDPKKHGPAMSKIQKRLREGKCMGCGKEKNDCSCKSTSD